MLRIASVIHYRPDSMKLSPWDVLFFMELLIIMNEHIKKFSSFIEPESSLSYPQEPVTGPCRRQMIQSTLSYPVTLWFVLILSSHLFLGLPIGLSPSRVPTKSFVWISRISPTRAAWPAHLILLDCIALKLFGKQCKLWSSSLCSFLQSHVTPSLAGPINLLSILYLCTSDNVTEHHS